MKLTMSWGKLASRTAGRRPDGLDALFPVLKMMECSMKVGWIVLKPDAAMGEPLAPAAILKLTMAEQRR
jgi:hypothetical protein